MFSISNINNGIKAYQKQNFGFTGNILSFKSEGDTFSISSENALKSKALAELNTIRDEVGEKNYALLKDGILNGNMVRLLDSGVLSIDEFRIPLWKAYPERLEGIIHLIGDDNMVKLTEVGGKVFRSNEFLRFYLFSKEKRDIFLSLIGDKELFSALLKDNSLLSKFHYALDEMPDNLAEIISKDEDRKYFYGKIFLSEEGDAPHIASYLDKKDILKIKSLIDEGFSLEISGAKNPLGCSIRLSRPSFDKSFDTEIYTSHIFEPEKREISSRIEINKTREGGEILRGQNKGAAVEYEQNQIQGDEIGLLDILSRIEIISDKDGPKAVISTKMSDILPGAMEVTKYNLSDYPEEFDVIEGIKNGTITGGERLSFVYKESSGAIVFEENFENDGVVTKRAYKEDGAKKSLSYRIEDRGKTLLNLEKSFVKVDNNSSTTIINGKKYMVKFDDSNMTAVVSGEDGDETVINFKEKLLHKENTPEAAKKFWMFLKDIPADILTKLHNIDGIVVEDDPLNSCYEFIENILRVSCSCSILAHEAGHISCHLSDGEVLKNPELIQIYDKEVDELNQKCPEEISAPAEYFLPVHEDIKGEGLDELFAETSTLFSTYSHPDVLYTRAHLLVKYFPKTIAKIADLTGCSGLK